MMPKFLLKAPTAIKESVDPDRASAASSALDLTTTSSTIPTPDTEMTATRKILLHHPSLESILILVDSNIAVDRVEDHSHYSQEAVECLQEPTGSYSAKNTIFYC
jgi:hypothetical protein